MSKHNNDNCYNVVDNYYNDVDNCNNVVNNCNNAVNNCHNVVNNCHNVVDINKCIKCDKNLSSKRNLEKHLLICKGVSNPFECHLCHKILANRSSKSKHLKICKAKLVVNNTITTDNNIPNSITNNDNSINTTNNNITNNNNSINTTNNNITNIIVFNPYNTDGKSLKTDHINLEFISKLLKIKEKDALTLYTKKILDNPENRCIKKTNLRSMFSEIHIGDNKWDSYYDNDIYPKFISEISNCLSELLVSKIVNKNIINKLIEFIDYMSDNGYCNNKDISDDIIKQYNEQIKKTKAIIYNLKNIMKN